MNEPLKRLIRADLRTKVAAAERQIERALRQLREIGGGDPEGEAALRSALAALQDARRALR